MELNGDRPRGDRPPCATPCTGLCVSSTGLARRPTGRPRGVNQQRSATIYKLPRPLCRSVVIFASPSRLLHCTTSRLYFRCSLQALAPTFAALQDRPIPILSHSTHSHRQTCIAPGDRRTTSDRISSKTLIFDRVWQDAAGGAAERLAALCLKPIGSSGTGCARGGAAAAGDGRARPGPCSRAARP